MLHIPEIFRCKFIILHAYCQTLKQDMVSFSTLFKYFSGKFNVFFYKINKTKKIVGQIQEENIGGRGLIFFANLHCPSQDKSETASWLVEVIILFTNVRLDMC